MSRFFSSIAHDRPLFFASSSHHRHVSRSSHRRGVYGNIGSKDRLDFTMVGPTVNEVSRIAALCRSVDQPLLVSSAFAAALGEARSRLASVGRYALRGVGRPQDLFTLE